MPAARPPDPSADPPAPTGAELLTRAGQGDAQAAADLLPQVYESLRALARRQMAREPAGLTLEPTALVNEAYLRLVGDQDPGWNGRRHFFGAAAQAMRRILVERARRQGRVRHGGELLDLHEALRALEAQDARAAEIVMLRTFAGLELDAVAQALDLSPRTVRREWSHARLWLYDRMHPRSARHDG